MTLAGSPVIRGWVTAKHGFRRCHSEVPVQVQRQRSNGGWRTVASTATDATGSYRARIEDRAGTYRVKAPRLVLGQGNHICRARTLGFTRP
jgi:hypothetical protein